jgi:regulation of enolase protein 1 (concanavalin A-like superfamily)
MQGFLDRAGLSWTAEPVSSTLDDESMTWRCRGGTDFWRVTESGIVKHDGHALLVPVDGDFRLEGIVAGDLVERYDQVGLFVQATEERWIKLGAELDGGLWLSAVHTRGESDWSREPLAGLPVRLAVERHADTIACSSEVDGSLRMFRQLHLPGPVSVGPYSCAPLGAGFEASARVLRLLTTR